MPIRPALELEEALAAYATNPTPALAREIERLRREAEAEAAREKDCRDLAYYDAAAARRSSQLSTAIETLGRGR